MVANVWVDTFTFSNSKLKAQSVMLTLSRFKFQTLLFSSSWYKNKYMVPITNFVIPAFQLLPWFYISNFIRFISFTHQKCFSKIWTNNEEDVNRNHRTIVPFRISGKIIERNQNFEKRQNIENWPRDMNKTSSTWLNFVSNVYRFQTCVSTTWLWSWLLKKIIITILLALLLAL